MNGRASCALAVTLAASLLASGCGDSDPTDPGDTLTQVEAMEVFNEILTAIFTVGASAPAAPADGPAGVPSTFTVTVSSPCDAGGSLNLTGTWVADVDASYNGTYSYDIVETPVSCGITTTSGSSYRVDGNPNIHFAGSYTIAGAQPTGIYNMTFDGGMVWTATDGGFNGSCVIDITYAFDWQTYQGSMVGSICGYAINQQF